MTNWANVSAIAQIAATVFAACSFFVLAIQVHRGSRAQDLQALFDFYVRVEEVERRILNNPQGQDHSRVINEFLNFAEVSCSACLKKLFGKVSSVIVREKLIEVVAIAYDNQEVAGAMMSGVTGRTTFSGIAAFRKFHQREIDAAMKGLSKSEDADNGQV